MSTDPSYVPSAATVLSPLARYLFVVDAAVWTVTLYRDGAQFLVEADTPALFMRGVALVFTTRDSTLRGLNRALRAERSLYLDTLRKSMEQAPWTATTRV